MQMNEQWFMASFLWNVFVQWSCLNPDKQVRHEELMKRDMCFFKAGEQDLQAFCPLEHQHDSSSNK